MAFIILIPIVLLPLFLLFYHLYLWFFEGNSLMPAMFLMLILLAAFIVLFFKFQWDEKLTLRTSKYALRFNSSREEAGLPLLSYDFTQNNLTWSTKLDTVSDKTKFVLLQKMVEEDDTQTNAEHEFNLMAKALNDSQVLYLKIDYNFLTKHCFGETTIGKLTRPSYKINNLQLFDECCTHVYKKTQVDSLLGK